MNKNNKNNNNSSSMKSPSANSPSKADNSAMNSLLNQMKSVKMGQLDPSKASNAFEEIAAAAAKAAKAAKARSQRATRRRANGGPNMNAPASNHALPASIIGPATFQLKPKTPKAAKTAPKSKGTRKNKPDALKIKVRDITAELKSAKNEQEKALKAANKACRPARLARGAPDADEKEKISADAEAAFAAATTKVEELKAKLKSAREAAGVPAENRMNNVHNNASL